ncbi:hypothetical protein S7335_1794 [Synechococcus sp. PCC 7335]|nr:hypothetical protein S7335_1794 [Synechococcus sp. PCC 7335]
MTIMNWVDILVPPQFLNPIWELETVGSLVEGAPLLLFATFLIFYGEDAYRGVLEQRLVRLLSQACLLVAVCFFLLMPIGANSTIRINREIDQQAGDSFGLQMAQIDQLEEQVDEISTEEIAAILESQGIQAADSDPTVSSKDRLLEYLVETRQNVMQETSAVKRGRKRSTTKNAIKWGIGAIIVSFTLVYLWRLTQWARVPVIKKLR